MDKFKQKIQETFAEANFTFPWIDEEVMIERTLASAEEYVISNIAVDLLSKEDRELFRDAYLSAPDIFDADEFLSEYVPNYDNEVDKYFDKWLENFKNNF